MNALKSALPLILASGGGQLLTLLSTPILARYYSPEHFGIWAIFVAVTSLLITVSALRYDMSILLPKSKKHSLMLSLISLRHVLAVTLLTTTVCLVLFLADYGAKYIYIFVPLSILFGGMSLITTAQLIYDRKYKEISISKFSQTVLTVVLNFVFIFSINLEYVGIGLVVSTVIGQLLCFLIQSTYLGFGYSSLMNLVYRRYSTRLAKKYRDFFTFSLPEAFVGTVSFTLPIYILSLNYTIEIVGQYTLAQRILMVPLAILGSALSSVYMKEFSEKISMNGSISGDLLRLWFYYLMGGFIPAILIYTFSVPVIVLLLGEEWQLTGEIIGALSIPAYIGFVFSISSPAHVVLRIQDLSLYFSLVALFLKTLVAILWESSVIELLVLLVLIDLLSSLVMNMLCYRKAVSQ